MGGSRCLVARGPLVPNFSQLKLETKISSLPLSVSPEVIGHSFVTQKYDYSSVLIFFLIPGKLFGLSVRVSSCRGYFHKIKSLNTVLPYIISKSAKDSLCHAP